MHANGNAHVAIDLACTQAEQGHQVIYASAGGDYTGLLERYGVGTENIVQNNRNPFKIAGSLIQLFKLCRSFRPDVIHAHMMAGAVLGYMVSRVCRIPLVTTVHNSFDSHSVLMRLGDRVVAVSEAERSFLIQRGFKPSRLAVVINGPNNSPREGFLQSKNNIDIREIKSPCVTTVCGLHRRKGVHDLLRGFAEALQIQPRWRLYLVGEGPDRDELVQLAAELNIAPSVNFLGAVGSPKGILESSDIFVLASYADPCSLAVAEARDAGCAIVATAVGGTPELLEFGNAGKLVPTASPHEIARELVPLMSDPSLLQTWRSKSKLGSEYFQVSRVTRDYEAVYSSLISVAGAQRLAAT
jgi:glycosyltransferase involved in cell wall biosynthesis